MEETHERYFCRACETDELTKEALKFIDEYVRSLKKEECVPDGEYERRLRQCSLCPALVGGSTCRFCGCLVLVRAKKISQYCPDPAGGRW
jgi:hypothetical protein